MRILTFILLVLFAGALLAQKCNFSLNKPGLLAEYGVRKVTVFVSTAASGKKELDAIYFLDSSGCAYKWITRRLYKNSYTWSVEQEKGGWRNGRKERYYALLKQDSTEDLVERRIEYFSPDGKRYREDIWRTDKGVLLKYTHLFGPNEPDTIDRKSYVTNERGDTLKKIFSSSHPGKVFYQVLVREGDKWSEQERSVSVRSGNTEESERWTNGKLVEAKKIVTNEINNDLTEVVVMDTAGTPLSKTVYNKHGDYSVYDFVVTKWVLKYEEFMPIADPVPEEAAIKLEDLSALQESNAGKVTKKKEKKTAAIAKTRKIKKLSKKAPVEKLLYHNAAEKKDLVRKDLVTTEGLLLESEMIRDKKKWFYEYEFLDE